MGNYPVVIVAGLVKSGVATALKTPFHKEINEGDGYKHHDDKLDVFAILHDFIVKL